MLASIDWLKKYVDINVTPEELAEKLTRVGLEVESVNYLGAGLEGVITGKVTQIERHPNSDHLWVCMMDYGSGEIVQILTGAQNVHQDDIVPVAVVGSQLPNGMKLKKAKMRGLDSFGMLCSAEELGIDAKLLLPEQRFGQIAGAVRSDLDVQNEIPLFQPRIRRQRDSSKFATIIPQILQNC